MITLGTPEAECWACSHLAHGPGKTANGCGDCFCTVDSAVAPTTHDTPEAALAAALRPWLRHKTWCNVKTDDPPDTERCKCGLRAALAPSEP
jgi:hypothetical protein